MTRLGRKKDEVIFDASKGASKIIDTVKDKKLIYRRSILHGKRIADKYRDSSEKWTSMDFLVDGVN